MSHSPSPWKVTKPGQTYVKGSDEHTVCCVGSDLYGVTAANASLIAAAPDLLRELISLLDVAVALRGRDKYNEEIQLAEAAIAKAERSLA